MTLVVSRFSVQVGLLAKGLETKENKMEAAASSWQCPEFSFAAELVISHFDVFDLWFCVFQGNTVKLGRFVLSLDSTEFPLRICHLRVAHSGAYKSGHIQYLFKFKSSVFE